MMFHWTTVAPRLVPLAVTLNFWSLLPNSPMAVALRAYVQTKRDIASAITGTFKPRLTQPR